LITATRPIPNPTPFDVRIASSFGKPVTSLICTGVVNGGGPIIVPVETRTSRTRMTIVLGGTAQISVNWSIPWQCAVHDWQYQVCRGDIGQIAPLKTVVPDEHRSREPRAVRAVENILDRGQRRLRHRCSNSARSQQR
jgi:hypothetical protein